MPFARISDETFLCVTELPAGLSFSFESLVFVILPNTCLLDELWINKSQFHPGPHDHVLQGTTSNESTVFFLLTSGNLELESG